MTTTSSLGTFVVGRHKLDIDRIYLRDGKIHFSTVAYGPLPAVEDATAKVYDPAGELVYEHAGTVSFGRIKPGVRLRADWPLEVTDKTSTRVASKVAATAPRSRHRRTA